MRKILGLVIFLVSCTQSTVNQFVNPILHDEIRTVLENQILNTWYPRVLDEEHGGYLTDFDFQWTRKGPQQKMIVTQARHVWTSSKAAELYPDNNMYLNIAQHGFAFLKDVLWDDEYGGFYNLVEQNGTVIGDTYEGQALKYAYGNAFGIYGLAAYANVSQDTSALELAKKAFMWLEEHSHDPIHGGYFQFLNRQGQAFTEGYNGTPAKDQNSSIHLLEAFTELYAVWDEPLVRTRLEEMLELIRDVMVDERGFLNLFFAQDWTPLSYRDSTAQLRKDNFNLDHVSFGHDIETAWLLMEATEALGHKHYEKTLVISKKMVDHGLRNGYDYSIGGVYDGGYYYRDFEDIEIIKDTKNWWAQVETLNTLYYMSKQFPEDELSYYKTFEQQWSYIKGHLVDMEHGGFYAGGLDKEPDRKTGSKSNIWKSPYHTARALMKCSLD